MIKELNHLTLSVDELGRSLEFYACLGFTPRVKWRAGAYLSKGELWLCLNAGQAAPAKDYTHIAFTVTSTGLEECRSLCKQYGWAQWQGNTSEGDSLYLLDPDGHKLELHCGDLTSRLAHLEQNPYDDLEWL